MAPYIVTEMNLSESRLPTGRSFMNIHPLDFPKVKKHHFGLYVVSERYVIARCLIHFPSEVTLNIRNIKAVVVNTEIMNRDHYW